MMLFSIRKRDEREIVERVAMADLAVITKTIIIPALSTFIMSVCTPGYHCHSGCCTLGYSQH